MVQVWEDYLTIDLSLLQIIFLLIFIKIFFVTNMSSAPLLNLWGRRRARMDVHSCSQYICPLSTFWEPNSYVCAKEKYDLRKDLYMCVSEKYDRHKDLYNFIPVVDRSQPWVNNPHLKVARGVHFHPLHARGQCTLKRGLILGVILPSWGCSLCPSIQMLLILGSSPRV